MKSKSNPFVRISLLCTNLAAANTAFAVDYNYGSGTANFSISASDTSRAMGSNLTTFNNNTGDMGIYWRGSACDATFMHFDLSSLQGVTINGTVNLNYTVNGQWGGGIYGAQVFTADAAWTGVPASAAPTFAAIAGATAPADGNYSSGQTATWGIDGSTLLSYVGSPTYFGLVVSATGSSTQAHFSGTPTLTGNMTGSLVRVLGATDWSAASWDNPNTTLTISSNGNVSGGNVSLSSGTTLSVLDSATLGSGNFAGNFSNGGTLSFGSSASQTLSGNISGSGSLTKSGDGTLILTGANSYSGTTSISGGTLQIGNGSITGTLGGGAVTNDGSLVFNRSDDLSVSNAIAGTGSLTKQGAGTLTLGQYPTNTGGITVSGGKLTVNAPWWGGWITNDLHISNGTLEINAPNHNELRINGGHGVYFDAPGAGILKLDDQTNFFANGGSLQFSTDGGAQNQITGSGINTDFAFGSTTFNVVRGDDPVSDLKVVCGINNSGNINKSGDGILELTSSNTYTGNTTVSDGTLLVSASGSLRFRPAGNGSNNSVSGSASSSLSFLGTATIDLTAANATIGNSWTLFNLDSFGSQTLTPAAVTSTTLGSFTEVFTGTWELPVTGAKWVFTEADGRLTYATAATDYDTWKTDNGVTGGQNADDDNDGLTNHEEYAFGLDPTGGSSVNPITSQLSKSTKKFSYTRRKPSLGTNLNYSVWFSENLASWTEDTGASEGTPVPSGDNETVEVTLSTLPGNPLPAKLFIQVRAN
jgi:autotransporter-associated beta strand protein